jgi:predicted enzyme related to lactoylglutathione lyase
MSRVTHFEIQADDPDRAGRFYKEAFGWSVDKWAGPLDYWLVGTGAKDEPGINGAIMKREVPGAQTINTIDVADLDEAIERVRKAGGSTLSDRTTVPGVGHFCYCADTEGNVFGIMQNDPGAK